MKKGWLFALCALTIVGCAYKTTQVHDVDFSGVDPGRIGGRAALLAVIVTESADRESGDGAPDREFSFTLSSRVPVNPLQSCVDRAGVWDPSDPSSAGTFQQKRQPANLLELLADCRDDEELLAVFDRQPTAFGQKQQEARREATLDSLGMLLHGLVCRSVEGELGDGKPFDELLSSAEALARLDALGRLEDFDAALAGLASAGRLSPDAAIELLEWLDVDALVCVAVSYGYLEVLHRSQNLIWTSTPITLETEVQTYLGSDLDRPVRLQFRQSGELQLKTIDEIGSLVSKGLRGKLKPDPR